MVTKSMCGADCWTDHRLIIYKMKFVLQPPKRSQGPKAPEKMDAAKLSTPAKKETLQTRLNGILENHVIDPGNIGSSWQTISEKVYTASLDAIGTASRHHQDWFDDQKADIKLILERKHQPHRSHQNDPTSTPKRYAFRNAKQECQRELRRMQNEWFDSKAKEIEMHSAGNNSKNFYSSLKAVYDRQAEHFDNVLNRPSSANEEVINRLPQVNINMSLSDVLSLDEMNKAISSLSNGKVPGSGGTPAEVFANGGPIITGKTHLAIPSNVEW